MAKRGPKPKRTGLLARRAKVDVTIDRALKRRWDEAVGRLRAARREGASSFDELWETVAEIVEHDPPLYLAGGFATARAFLTEHVGESERTARRLMRVAKYASPAEEARYGISKLDAALAYLETKAGAPRGRIPVDFTALRIPVKGDPERKTVAFSEASVKQVAAATRALASPSRAKRSPFERAVVGALRDGGAEGVTVRFVGGRLSLGNIGPAEVRAVAAALAAVELPSS